MPMLARTLAERALHPGSLDERVNKAVITLMGWQRVPDTETARKTASSMLCPIPKAHFFIGGRPGRPSAMPVACSHDREIDGRPGPRRGSCAI